MNKKIDDKPYSGRVILTYGRSLMALTAAHSLGKRGVEVVGCDSVDMTVLNFSRYVSDFFVHADAKDDLDQYLDDIEENVKKFKPDDDRPYVLMPMFRDARILAEFKDRLEPFITVAAPPYEAIRRVDTKDAFAVTAKELGLCVPETFALSSAEDLETIKCELSFPCLIKPTDTVGGRGIHAADNYDQLRHLFSDSLKKYGQAPLIQEMIDGEDYCLSTICEEGKIAGHMAYRNLHQFPAKSGAGIMRETVEDNIFLPSAEKLVKALNWNGVAQFDFRWSGKAEDPAYLIEVNPRFWAGLFHSVQSGVDFPWQLYELASRGSIQSKDEAVLGTKTKVPGLWMVSAVQEIAESETHFDKLKEAMSRSKHSESWKERLSLLKEAITDAVDEKDILEKIKIMGAQAKDAKSEFDSEDDPFIGLGALFVVSSLIRHGTLPPELKAS